MTSAKLSARLLRLRVEVRKRKCEREPKRERINLYLKGSVQFHCFSRT